MNNNDHYERREDRAMPEQPSPQPQTDEAVNALAVHRDPSVPIACRKPREAKAQRSIAWVRPSELPTWSARSGPTVASTSSPSWSAASRRAPAKAARAGRRISRTAIARPEPATPSVTTTEELGL